MKEGIFAFLAAIVFVCAAGAQSAPVDVRILDLHAEKEMSLAQVLPALQKHRIILVGEIHDKRSSHAGQLLVIRTLKEAGVRLTIGLEMFRADSQRLLDRWIEGEMSAGDFRKAYYDNWNFPWSLYRKIFEYAREKRIPLVGLNVAPDVTRQVAEEGFRSLSPQQRAKLPNVTCDVGPGYRSFIKRAYGEHAHGKLDFNHFCEAQLVWDKSMAFHAIGYAAAHPHSTMVLLAGAGHTRRQAIPTRIADQSKLSVVTILPEVPGHIEPGEITIEDADYILLREKYGLKP